MVLRAQGESPAASQALSELCEAYYQPVFKFLCHQGRSEDAARDLAQEFFARLLQRGKLGQADPGRGRFRSYLLGAVKHFLADQNDHARRAKRGGGQTHRALDAASEDSAEPGVSPPDMPSDWPENDAYFDRAWALTIMERSLNQLEEESRASGKTDSFACLKPWLVGDTEKLSQAEAAHQLGWSETAVKVAVHRLRKRFRETVRQEIAQTVAEGTDIDLELRYLVDVLAHA